MSKQGFRCLIAGIIAIVLAGCSAGGGETGTGQNPDTVTVGVITGFGSVFINGIEYETDTSDISLDGLNLKETDLKVGMIVTLAGDVNADGVTGTAFSISYNDNVEGMVLANTVATNNQLVILGQTIIVDSFDTVFESKVDGVTTIEQIVRNNIVEVSGHTSGNGKIYATRIEVKEASRTNRELELEGIVSNVTATTFKIGQMTIVYTADMLKDFNGADLKNDDFVEVKSENDLNANDQLVASKIELKELHKDVKDLSVGKEFAFEGVITEVIDDGKFLINGQVIIHNNTTEINDIDLIVEGKKAKVEGVVNENNEIVAKQIEIKSEDKIKIEGLISDYDFDSKTFVINGDLITVTNTTSLRDERDGIEEGVRHFFNFSNLENGFNIEVTYYFDVDLDKFIATKLELEDVEVEETGSGGEDSGDEEHKNDWEIKNSITSYNESAQTIVILHRTIDISNIEDFDWSIAEGKVVEVRGDIINDVWVAVELKVRQEEQKPAEKEEDEEGT